MSKQMKTAAILMTVAIVLALFCAFYMHRQANTRRALLNKSAELAADGFYADASRMIDKAMTAPPDETLSDDMLSLKKAEYLQKAGNTDQALNIVMRVIKDNPEGSPEFDEGWAGVVAICTEEEEFGKLATLLEGSELESVKSRYYNYLVYDPVFRQQPGEYTGELNLVIESQGVGTVFYTIDGSEPTEKSNLYTDGVLLRPGVYTVKAMFVNRYGLRSNTVTGTYLILDE